ncbi:C6 transcription factor [Colletotrichum karsti]|uniref:C6 transcription factor n=1 Tax=Colletotrichum karsti TaxID=1095194 RepID=A0A9P6HW68_9PEZI|nr:C6 transcription factor [Colletotrichum karsti]KAF9871117.1 C6 transcription factor [Colletotrichum karsti]
MFNEIFMDNPPAPASRSPHPESPVSPHTAPPGGGGPPPPRKSRVALACKRFSRPDADDGSVMAVIRVAGPYPGGKSLYISALEERIAFLEARMPDFAEDHFANPSTATISTSGPPPEAKSQRRESQDSFSEEEPSSLVDGVAYLSLCASGTTDTAPEPFYLGSSSGATIARMIQSSIFHGAGDQAIRDALAAAQPGVLRPPLSGASPSSQSDDPMSEFPSPSNAKMLFDVFFDRLHTRWPILDRKLYISLFEGQYSQGALPIQQRSILHLIYAISARFLQLTKKPCDVDPERHLLAAIEPMDFILEHHNLATVQFLLLLAVHGQRSPFGAGCWSQVRYAMTFCIELGLHRKHSSIQSTHSALDIEIRRRVFWACYCLDRMTSVVLGRTFAIADRDINVELPSDDPIFWELTALGTPPESPDAPWSNMKPFIHIIKLRRIQSRIHRRVYRVDKDVAGSPEDRAKLDTKMASILAELDDWARAIPHPPKGTKTITWMYDPESSYHDSRDFFNLQYHKSVLSLFTVLLPTLNTSDPRFLICARSAACVCTTYKRLNQQKTLSYTMMALHSCFIAGLTLVYCLWRDRSLFSYDALEATRACSQSLTIFGEKWPGAVKYRDIFDALSGSLFKTIVNPSSSEPGSKPLRVDLEEAVAPPAGPEMAPKSGAGVPGAETSKPGMSHAISNAVKEAFMEVDEEAPGGWQGWKMFNEMVHDESGYTRVSEGGYGEAAHGE